MAKASGNLLGYSRVGAGSGEHDHGEADPGQV